MAGRLHARGKTAARFDSDPFTGEAPVVKPAKREKRSKGKDAAERFAEQCRQYQLPEPVRELQFAKHIGRRWRFDFAWPDHMVAVEIEGLVVFRGNDGALQVKGRHASITGFRNDAVKYAEAAVMGWTVLRFEQSQVRDKTAIEYAQRVLFARGWRRDDDGNETED